jgi:hypothetical protein
VDFLKSMPAGAQNILSAESADDDDDCCQAVRYLAEMEQAAPAVMVT